MSRYFSLLFSFMSSSFVIIDDNRHDPFADLLHEVHEIPNLDINFTFDDDIINWYFRRE